MRLLVDADFLISLIKEDDKNHALSIKKIEGLKTAIVFITPFTIPETVTVLSYKVSHHAAKKFLKEARSKFIELSLNGKVFELADQIFLSQNVDRISWIDCLNAAMVRYYRLEGILSYDKFYTKIGLSLF